MKQWGMWHYCKKVYFSFLLWEMKSKSYFMHNFSQIWFCFLFDFNIAKMHIFCSFFEKITVVSDQKWPLLATNSEKINTIVRLWSDGAGFKTEAQKSFNARTMHTTWRHREDDLGNAF